MPIDKRQSKETMIKELIDSYKKTGKIGNTTPRNMAHAIRIASKIAYSSKEKSEDAVEDLQNILNNDIIDKEEEGIMTHIQNSISIIYGSESYTDVINKFGKDTPHFMMDTLKTNLERKGYQISVEESGDDFIVSVSKNGNLVKESTISQSKVADNEITEKDLI